MRRITTIFYLLIISFSAFFIAGCGGIDELAMCIENPFDPICWGEEPAPEDDLGLVLICIANPFDPVCRGEDPKPSVPSPSLQAFAATDVTAHTAVLSGIVYLNGYDRPVNIQWGNDPSFCTRDSPQGF